MENSAKGRYWSILVFEDNIEKNPNWLEYLLGTHMRFCISPYHDKDLWTEEDLRKHPERKDIVPGKPKKAHYHILFHCDDNMTFKSMKEMTTELGLPIPQRVMAPRGLYRYFWHLDNPEKAQYNADDIRHYNGSDPFDYICELSEHEKDQMIFELIQFFRAGRFLKYADFLIAVRERFNDDRYFRVARGQTLLYREIMKDNISDYNNAYLKSI